MTLSKIVTRFAPSPTGYLHIGGARTALFNYLFAKKNKGKFLLRIEDTDEERSSQDSINTIINGLEFLGLHSDKDIIFQKQRQNIHKEYAYQLLKQGKAYKCYCTKEELEKRRKKYHLEGKVYQYDGKCRNIKQEKNLPYTIRIKVDKHEITTIDDIVIGVVSVQNKEIDDFIILRSDETPTYMFAVVVDDYDMNITHVIRGDDHFTNTFRQYQIYKAFNWSIPYYAHLPLIYSSDGKKMSKRNNTVAVNDYKDLGFLPQALINYLMLLGWSYNNQDIYNFTRSNREF